MATSIPEKVKTTDLARFIVRGEQVGHVKPIISYWCGFANIGIRSEA